MLVSTSNLLGLVINGNIQRHSFAPKLKHLSASQQTCECSHLSVDSNDVFSFIREKNTALTGDPWELQTDTKCAVTDQSGSNLSVKRSGAERRTHLVVFTRPVLSGAVKESRSACTKGRSRLAVSHDGRQVGSLARLARVGRHSDLGADREFTAVSDDIPLSELTEWPQPTSASWLARRISTTSVLSAPRRQSERSQPTTNLSDAHLLCALTVHFIRHGC
jgi:hypothetical protein